MGLYVGDTCQGRARIESGVITPISPYMKAMEPVIANLVGRTGSLAKLPKALVIGAGACIIPSMLVKKGFRVDVVEPNEEMFKIADIYFNYQPHGVHYICKGEDYLGEYFEKYDVIFLDAFNGLGVVPELYNVRIYKQLTSMSNKVLINYIAKNSEEIDENVLYIHETGITVKRHVIHNKTPFQAVLECTNEPS